MHTAEKIQSQELRSSILTLYSAGYSVMSIASKKGKTHTTILYHLRKSGIWNRKEKHICSPPSASDKYEHLWIEPTNQGHNYKEYLIINHGKKRAAKILRYL